MITETQKKLEEVRVENTRLEKENADLRVAKEQLERQLELALRAQEEMRTKMERYQDELTGAFEQASRIGKSPDLTP